MSCSPRSGLGDRAHCVASEVITALPALRQRASAGPCNRLALGDRDEPAGVTFECTARLRDCTFETKDLAQGDVRPCLDFGCAEGWRFTQPDSMARPERIFAQPSGQHHGRKRGTDVSVEQTGRSAQPGGPRLVRGAFERRPELAAVGTVPRSLVGGVLSRGPRLPSATPGTGGRRQADMCRLSGLAACREHALRTPREVRSVGRAHGARAAGALMIDPVKPCASVTPIRSGASATMR